MQVACCAPSKQPVVAPPPPRHPALLRLHASLFPYESARSPTSATVLRNAKDVLDTLAVARTWDISVALNAERTEEDTMAAKVVATCLERIHALARDSAQRRVLIMSGWTSPAEQSSDAAAAILRSMRTFIGDGGVQEAHHPVWLLLLRRARPLALCLA